MTLRAACALALLVVSVGCSPGDGEAPTASPVVTERRPATPPPGGVLIRFPEATVAAELADDDQERSRGLMNRETLDSHAGMLFVFPSPSTGGFWMKDTLIPLSIAFMRSTGGDTYEVAEIIDMQPCPPEEDCPLYQPAQPYDVALEVNRGWFAANGVRIGTVASVDGLPA